MLLGLVRHRPELVHPVAVDIDEKVPRDESTNSHVIENDEDQARVLGWRGRDEVLHARLDLFEDDPSVSQSHLQLTLIVSAIVNINKL